MPFRTMLERANSRPGYASGYGYGTMPQLPQRIGSRALPGSARWQAMYGQALTGAGQGLPANHPLAWIHSQTQQPPNPYAQYGSNGQAPTMGQLQTAGQVPLTWEGRLASDGQPMSRTQLLDRLRTVHGLNIPQGLPTMGQLQSQGAVPTQGVQPSFQNQMAQHWAGLPAMAQPSLSRMAQEQGIDPQELNRMAEQGGIINHPGVTAPQPDTTGNSPWNAQYQPGRLAIGQAMGVPIGNRIKRFVGPTQTPFQAAYRDALPAQLSKTATTRSEPCWITSWPVCPNPANPPRRWTGRPRSRGV